MIAVIMAGGSGTRFWPQSRKVQPKQFLDVVGEKSMIRLTMDRLLEKLDKEKIYVVTAASQVDLVKEHLPELPIKNIIAEPFGMNTAPCIGLSYAYVKRFAQPNELMVVLPADHIIAKIDAFNENMKRSEIPASQGHLVTFGIIPTYPATGYGYIEAGEKVNDFSMNVTRFKEKPDYSTAQSFLKAGNFFWNSGMFAWTIETIENNFRSCLPEVTTILDEISQLWDSEGEGADISDLYAKMPRIPVDIGIMEKAEKRVVIPVDLGWSDVGSWRALADISESDENSNTIDTENFVLDSKGNYIRSKKFVALIGVEDLVLVETDDAILLAKKDRAEDVKKVVDYLKSNKEELL
ncbi:MAG: mannose-1-phosphate guanylyltransferase [Candidatus Cloacimonetes bacterium 4572_65]|nr:MAG: mannose-1-phosphate guanylyltransferase [Candidatus Cloacimonetes bacterium 4572_65]